MTPGYWPLSLIQGQTKLTTVTWSNKDLTGCSVRFIGKNSPTDADSDLTLTDSNGGITWVSRSPSGVFRLNLTASLTANIAEGSGDHILWIDFPDGSKFPLLAGPYQCRKV